MSCNRLRLNWTLDTSEERAQFIQQYITQLSFSPNEEELEMMGNYILWGRDPDGQNTEQKGFVQLERRNTAWVAPAANISSLDELLETPTFAESELKRPEDPIYKFPKEIFSRSDVLAQCPAYLENVLNDLFHRIDTLELQINYYDLAHDKRKNPPREELLQRFSDEERIQLRDRAQQWTQRKYLQQRHLLVELRREQYTYKDFCTPAIQHHTTPRSWFDASLNLDSEITILPNGLYSQSNPLFAPTSHLCANHLNEDLCAAAISFNVPPQSPLYINFCDPEHIYALITQYDELSTAAEKLIALNQDTLIPALQQTLEYYISEAQLSDSQQKILQLKRANYKNSDIAAIVNKQFHKTYTPNYISTIYRKKILPAIADAATYHKNVIRGLLTPQESFKTCSTCGTTYLRSDDNFVHKTRSKDGFSNRCKNCDKKERARLKHSNT